MEIAIVAHFHHSDINHSDIKNNKSLYAFATEMLAIAYLPHSYFKKTFNAEIAAVLTVHKN